MKKALLLAAALLLSTTIGVFIGRSTRLSGPTGAADPAAISTRTHPESRATPAGKSKNAKPKAPPNSLTALAELVSTNWNASEYNTFLQAIGALGVEEIAALMSDLPSISPYDERAYKLAYALASRWATLDPDGAWKAVLQIKDKNLSRKLVISVINSIANSDFTKARLLLSTVNDPQIRQSALYDLISQAATEKPEEALKMLSEEDTARMSYDYYQTLFLTWAKDDPETAIARLSQIKGSQNRQQALQGIASALVVSDPQRALALLDAPASVLARKSLLNAISSNWLSHDSEATAQWIKTLPAADQSEILQRGAYQFIDQDPAKAAELFSALPINGDNGYNFSTIASSWAQQDLAAALSWAEAIPEGYAKTRAMGGIIGFLAKTDPIKAATIFGQTTVNHDNCTQVSDIATKWIKQDPAAAIAWVESLDFQGEVQNHVQSQLLINWVSEDPAAAGNYAISLQDGEMRDAAIGTLVSSWGREDPGAAKDWIMKSLQGDSKNRSMDSLIQILANQARPTALEFLEEATAGLPAQEIRKDFDGSAREIVSNWVRDDPKGASQWVMGLPEGARSGSLHELVNAWSNYDIQGAASFVNTLSAGEDRDRAVSSLVDDLREKRDYPSIFDWVATVGDADKRESMISSAAREWKEEDPAAASAAVSRSSLSKEAKTRILKSLED